MKLIIDLLRYIIWGPVREVISLLGIKYLIIAEKAFSKISYLILSERKKILNNELRTCFGTHRSKDDIERIIFESFIIYVSSQLRLFYLKRINKNNVSKYISLEGVENLDFELNSGRGAIILNAHFGPYMMIMPALGHRGYNVNQIALQGPPPWGERRGLEKRVYDMKFSSIEGNMPVTFINVASGPSSIRSAIKALKDNEIVLYPSTGMAGMSFHRVSFMGRHIMLNLAPFNLALKTGATILPAFVIRDREGTLSLRIEKTIKFKSAEMGAEMYIKILGDYVEKYPEHFIMYIYEINKNVRFGGTPFFAK